MGQPGPSAITRVLIRQKEGTTEEEPERWQHEEDCPMLLAVKTEEGSQSKKAGVLWKMEKARKWISPSSVQEVTALLTPVRFRRDFQPPEL